MPSTLTCEFCQHFLLGVDPAGTCHRRDPVTLLDSTDTQQTFWPALVKTDWCGEHSGYRLQSPAGHPGRAPKLRQNVKGRR